MFKYVLRECADCGMFAITACTICFSFFPDKVFSVYPTPIFELANNETGMIIQNHLFLFLVFLVVSGIAKILYAYFRTEYTIKGRNYVIKIEYGDLLKQSGKKVIAFDECFTTKVGDSLGDIKSQSINGQYLSEHTDIDDQCIEELIKEAELKKLKSKSKYKNKDRYESGRVLRYNNDLLMAFVKLNEKGSGRMSRSEYLESLSVLWEEISDYCDNCDIYIPILGSGQTTRFDGEPYTRQDLLNMIVDSYKLSPHKLKLPLKLHIVCRKNDGVNLNHIGRYI